jgi:hypothetical protein
MSVLKHQSLHANAINRIIKKSSATTEDVTLCTQAQRLSLAFGIARRHLRSHS